MTLTTVPVAIAANLITGCPMALGTAHFELTASDIDGAVVVPAGLDVVLDVNGAGTAHLWPNTRGVNGTQYRVLLTDASGALQYSGVATVPASACSLHAILNTVVPPKVSDAQAAATAAQGYAAQASAAAGIASGVLTDSGFVAVKNDLANIDAVAAVASSVNTVAGDHAAIVIVAGDHAPINTVASDHTAIVAVAGAVTNINAVAGDLTNINTVAADLANVDVVAGDHVALTAVAGGIASVNTAAANIASIQNAAANATAAQNAANAAAASAASVSATALLTGWAFTQAFQIVSATRDSNEAITTASIVWPDGSTGTFTADTLSTAFPGAIDAWHATYVTGGITKTVTQPAVTRDSNGAVTAQPTITIA